MKFVFVAADHDGYRYAVALVIDRAVGEYVGFEEFFIVVFIETAYGQIKSLSEIISFV